MFSFSHSAEEGENTPFFEDNEEKPSLFNSQASQQPSAFDLFNNVSVSSHLIQSNYHIDKQKGRQSKKSIIMQLDQFDRREAFSNLNQTIDQSNFYSQANAGSSSKNQMAESVVRQFESNQVFPNSQSFNWGKAARQQKHNQQPESNFDASLNQEKNKKTKLFEKISLRMKNVAAVETKAPDKGKQQIKPHPQEILKCSNGGKNEEAMLKVNLQIKKQLKMATPSISGEQRVENKGLKPTQSLSISPIGKEQVKMEQRKPDNDSKSSKQFAFNPLSFQQIFKQSNDLKSSKVSLGQQKQPPKPANLEPAPLNSNSNAKINFSNILKRSRISDSQSKPQLGTKNEPNPVVIDCAVENQKIVPDDNKSVDKPQKLNIKIGSLNIKNLGDKTEANVQKTETKTQQTPKEPIKTVNLSNKLQNVRKQEHSFLPTKANKVKQKPCLNLKLLKQPTKIEHKIEVEKKLETNNLIKEQQMSKRQDITTAKLFKNAVFTNGLSFQAAGLTNPNKETEEARKNQETPKIIKIEQKSIKLMGNRETEKLKQDQHKISEKTYEETTSAPQETDHRVDFSKYEKQIDLLQDEIEQTKKKYSFCDEGFKDIFLLLNRANTMLNDKFMSQTQANQTKQKIQ